MYETKIAPSIEPHAPTGLAATGERDCVEVSWDGPTELDFDHYRIYRGFDSTHLNLHVPYWESTFFVDTDIQSCLRYFYRVAAVDQDGHEGGQSSADSDIPATFDQGVLVFDVTADGSGNPDESEQMEFYTHMLDGYLHTIYQCDYQDLPLEKSLLGQYGAILLVDDDDDIETWPQDTWSKLDWYRSNGAPMIYAGWQTVRELEYALAFSLPDELDVHDISRVNQADCLGGTGVGGFPTVAFDSTKIPGPWNGQFGLIWTLDSVGPGAEVILRYNSASGDPEYSDLPVGILHDNGVNTLGLINLPLYYLRQDDASALMAALVSRLGIAPVPPGDLTGDGFVDVLDLASLIDALFRDTLPPSGYGPGDVNADCTLDPLDLAYLIDYLYVNGAAPQEGCIP
jgi:hypothetical protein